MPLLPAASLALAFIASLGIGSLSWLGRAVAAIASKCAHALRSKLLVPGMSSVRPMMSSKYRLWDVYDKLSANSERPMHVCIAIWWWDMMLRRRR